MNFLKTSFSRVHAVVMLLALATVLLGAGMALGFIPFVPFGEFHGALGVAIFPTLLLLPLLFKKRKNLYAALKAKLLITKRDIAHKNPFAIAAKVVTLVMALAFLLQLCTGALVETGLGYQLFPTFSMLSFHMSFLYILPALILLHLILTLLGQRSTQKVKK